MQLKRESFFHCIFLSPGDKLEQLSEYTHPVPCSGIAVWSNHEINNSSWPLSLTKQHLWKETWHVVAREVDSTCKESSCNSGNMRQSYLIPGSRRFPRGGNGNPFQYFCLEKSMDRGVWNATIHRVTESDTQLSTWHFRLLRQSEKPWLLKSDVIM